MKKTFKKLFAALLAAALVLAMAVPAFAVTNATKGSIKIDHTVSGETYTIYRMFKLDSYNAESNTYSYTVEPAWETFFSTGAGKDYITLDGQGHPTWKAGVDSTDDSDTVAALAKAALTWAKVKGITGTAETATGDTVTFFNLDLGYYLVDSSMGALCGLNTTTPNVTIKEKNGQPTIEKEVKNGDAWGTTNDAKIGDTVEFKITIHVEAGAQSYKVTDTMEKGLSFISGSVKIDNEALNDNNATLTLKQNDGDPTFTLAFADSYVANKVGQDIVVTYTATLNENAVVAGNKNSATLHYSNKQTVNKETTTYTYEFDLLKVDGADHKLLNGAEFKLYDAENGGSVIKVVPVAGGYRVANGDETGAVDTIKVDGKVHISGLDKTTYWLEETKAPDGYNKLTERKPVNLTNGSNNTTLTSDTWSEADHGVAVENNAGAILPGTGGMGTTLFYVIGGGLMVAAVVLLVTKKRMEHKN
jgi:fimbrial isopeptide formation D2 family protein/LPXTG-motif cell wall-anchored protein